MEVRAQDIVDSVDLSKSEVFLPLYESIVNSIISLLRIGREDGKIDVFIERENEENQEPDLFGRNVPPIKSLEIVDNGEGFTEANFKSFNAPYTKLNKKYGCKGIGRFTMLAMFNSINVVSIYKEEEKWYRREFVFDGTKELVYNNRVELDADDKHEYQTKVKLTDAMSIINHQLAITLHLPEGSVIEPDIQELENEYLSLASVASQDTWKQTAAEQNIGIRQANVAAGMAEQKIKATKAASLPSVALVVEDNLFGPYTNDLIPVNSNVNAWFVGLGVKYNLSSLWNNRHQVRKARIDARQSREQVTLARKGVENGVQAGYVNFLTAFTEVNTQEKQVELADQNYAVVENRYQNELALLTDMLDASSLKLSAEMSLVNARISLLYSYYKLKYVTSSL